MTDAPTPVPQDAPYKDASRPVAERVEDLLSRMTLAEKAGLMFHTMLGMGKDGELADAEPSFHMPSTHQMVVEQHLNHFNLFGAITDARQAAEWHNKLQDLASSTRLGIPVTISTDPRHHTTDNAGASFLAGVFSSWPETLGLAALRSTDLVEKFGDIARQEYVALGIRTALHPQIDLATEPRWCRINATFGEESALTGELGAAYIRGFQGETFGADSVSTMTKHFPGGGPQKNGEDPHFSYGREQVYPGGNQLEHLQPFIEAIAAGTRQMMPYYGMPVDTDWQPVGFAFNKQIVTDLLRDKLGFEGIVCTDWGLVTDSEILGTPFPARAWGMEHATPLERVVRILEAGCDQFGGEQCPELVVEAVESGAISEARLDESVRRLLREKFEMGLFENRHVDVEKAAAVVGCDEFTSAGYDAQRRSVTLLTNHEHVLPLKAEGQKVYSEGIDPQLLVERGFQVVDDPEGADLALLRLQAPFEPREGGLAAFFHAGSLEYSDAEKDRQAKIYSAVPTIVDIYLDRPAVIPEIPEQAVALVASYGTSGRALLDVLLGQAQPEGRLPFDLPRSIEAVVTSRSDMPFDTEDPVFRFGYGLGTMAPEAGFRAEVARGIIAKEL